MAKYMLIMRNSGSVQRFEDMDFDAVITAMGKYNEADDRGGRAARRRGPRRTPRRAPSSSSPARRRSSPTAPTARRTSCSTGSGPIQAATKEEAVEWAKRAPLTAGNKIEVRRVTDESDFAGHEDNEYLQKEREWRAAERA